MVKSAETVQTAAKCSQVRRKKCNSAPNGPFTKNRFQVLYSMLNLQDGTNDSEFTVAVSPKRNNSSQSFNLEYEVY